MKFTYDRDKLNYLLEDVQKIADKLTNQVASAYEILLPEIKSYESKPWIYRVIFDGPIGRYGIYDSPAAYKWRCLKYELRDVDRLASRVKSALTNNATSIILNEDEILILEVYGNEQ